MEVDEVQKPENVTGNMIYLSKIENQEKEKGYDSKSSMVNALQDANNSEKVEPRTSGKKGIVCGVEVAMSKETIECQKEDKTKLDNASKKNKCGGNKGKKKSRVVSTSVRKCKFQHTPLNNNHVSSSVKQNHLTKSAGIHSCTSVEHKVTNTVQKQPIPPKGISFINLAKLSPSFSSLKQDTVTTKESPVQIGTREDQSAFHKTQNKVDIPKKLPAVTPKE
ncbi:hypothetical protein GLYMA_02G244050v4 [Glycine max]|nr:hypothetical protein GLYMA_02G244050v4 [Glycine max]KAH1061896.1 hypothetical protein GYH30_005077 [Glycine max]